MNGAPAYIVGNTVAEPELRFTTAGIPWVTFDIAVNDIRTTKNGERTDKTHYVKCKLWRDAAENLVESIGKGTRVIVLGKWVQENWETQNGDKRRDWVIEVDEVGPSVRWATAKVTRNARANAQVAKTPVSTVQQSNQVEVLESPIDEENPFL
jgi:single-strand DNA-binding protein